MTKVLASVEFPCVGTTARNSPHYCEQKELLCCYSSSFEADLFVQNASKQHLFQRKRSSGINVSVWDYYSRKEDSLLVLEKLAALRLISCGGVKLIKNTSRCNYVCKSLKVTKEVRERSLSFKNHMFKANIFIWMLLFYHEFEIFLRMLHRKTQFEDSGISSHLRNIVGRIREQNLLWFCRIL